MILELIIIFSIVAVFIIFARHLPNIKEKLKDYEHNFSNASKEIPKKESKIDKKIENKKNSFFAPKDPVEEKLKEADKKLSEKKFEQAEEIYLKLVSTDPKNAKIYNRIGILYLEQGNDVDAKEAFREAIKIDDKVGSRWYNLALAQISLKEYRSAINSLVTAIKLENKNQKYLDTLKDVRQRLKKVKPIQKDK